MKLYFFVFVCVVLLIMAYYAIRMEYDFRKKMKRLRKINSLKIKTLNMRKET